MFQNSNNHISNDYTIEEEKKVAFLMNHPVYMLYIIVTTNYNNTQSAQLGSGLLETH